MHRDNDASFPLSSVARSHTPELGDYTLAHEGMGSSPTRPQQEAIIASHDGLLDIAARLARIEDRLANAEDSLILLQACRRYVELRLDKAFADVAGDVGPALPKW